MKPGRPCLRVQVLLVNGSAVVFAQSDFSAAGEILADFHPGRLFDRGWISLFDGVSLRSFPVESISRIDLTWNGDREPDLPPELVEAVELTWDEFHALIHNPVIRDQWKNPMAVRSSMVTFLEVEMAGGSCLYLTIEAPPEAWFGATGISGFLSGRPGLCFRLRTGGIAVLNLKNLVRLACFPGPPRPESGIWRARQLDVREPAPTQHNGHAEIPAGGWEVPISEVSPGEARA